MLHESIEPRPVSRDQSPRRGRLANPDRGSRRFRPILTALEGRALLATISVASQADSGVSTLRQAIADAAPGDTINFTVGVSTITLTSGPLSIGKDLTILGPGPGNLTISGGGKVGVFAIQPATLTTTTPALKVVIGGLTIADGLATGGGGGVSAFATDLSLYTDAFVNNAAQQGGAVVSSATSSGATAGNPPSAVLGSLTIVSSTFTGNTALVGGAIFNQGTTLSVDSSQFTGNQAITTGIALGGAILNNGTATVTNSTFSSNLSNSPLSKGGAIHNGFSSTLSVAGSTFVNNHAISSGVLGSSYGGALSGDSGNSMNIFGTTFAGNSAEGGGGTSGGGAIQEDAGAMNGFASRGLTISGSIFLGNRAGQSGLGGGVAMGGAISNSSDFLHLSTSLFEFNQALGGSGGATGYGGYAIGGAVTNQSPLTLTASWFGSNVAQGGPGGRGAGFAVGGGLTQQHESGSTPSSISDSRFINNVALGGAGTGASVAGGFAQGGGLNFLQNSGPINLTGDVVAGDSAVGGAGGPAGASSPTSGGAGGQATGGGLAGSSSTVTVSGSLFLGDLARGGNAPAGVAGAGQGGAISFSGSPQTLTLMGVPILFSEALGGDGLSGGNGEGGALYIAGLVSITDSVVTGNLAQGGSAGQGQGGGTFLATGGSLALDGKSILGGNRASTAGNDRYPA